jgi:HEAT repeats
VIRNPRAFDFPYNANVPEPKSAKTFREVPIREILEALKAKRLQDIPVEVLEAIGGRGAQSFIRIDSDTNDYWGRAWAARALCYKWSDSALEPLLIALNDSHWRVRMNAARALSLHAGFAAVDALCAALEDPHWRVREAAAIGLKRIADPEALPALEDAFWDAHENVQGAIERAITALEKHR